MMYEVRIETGGDDYFVGPDMDLETAQAAVPCIVRLAVRGGLFSPFDDHLYVRGEAVTAIYIAEVVGAVE